MCAGSTTRSPRCTRCTARQGHVPGPFLSAADRQRGLQQYSPAVGIPYTYWAIGGTDPQTYRTAEKNGHLDDLPGNHSPKFLPPLQPTLRTGTEALTAAALAWLAPHPGS